MAQDAYAQKQAEAEQQRAGTANLFDALTRGARPFGQAPAPQAPGGSAPDSNPNPNDSQERPYNGVEGNGPETTPSTPSIGPGIDLSGTLAGSAVQPFAGLTGADVAGASPVIQHQILGEALKQKLAQETAMRHAASAIATIHARRVNGDIGPEQEAKDINAIQSASGLDHQAFNQVLMQHLKSYDAQKLGQAGAQYPADGVGPYTPGLNPDQRQQLTTQIETTGHAPTDADFQKVQGLGTPDPAQVAALRQIHPQLSDQQAAAYIQARKGGLVNELPGAEGQQRGADQTLAMLHQAAEMAINNHKAGVAELAERSKTLETDPKKNPTEAAQFLKLSQAVDALHQDAAEKYGAYDRYVQQKLKGAPPGAQGYGGQTTAPAPPQDPRAAAASRAWAELGQDPNFVAMDLDAQRLRVKQRAMELLTPAQPQPLAPSSTGSSDVAP